MSTADVADKYCGGYFRYTTRCNVEFLVSEESNIKPFEDDLRKRGLNDRGIGSRASITMLSIHRMGTLPLPQQTRQA